MYSVQRPRLDFNEFFALDESDRLVLVLQTINAERLLRALAGPHDAGQCGYPARVLWSALIAGVVYRLPAVAELCRHLRMNPYLRYVCGITSAAPVPSQATFSRFLDRLVAHADLVDACFDYLVRRFAALAPGFGQNVAADSSDVHAYAQGKKSGAADSDATWSAKGSKKATSKPSGKHNPPASDGQTPKEKKTSKDADKYWWFGYKLHLLIDAT